MSIFEVFNVILKTLLETLFEECELVFNMCLKNMVFKHLITKQFDTVPYEKSKKSREGGRVLIFIEKNLY